jgi:hypothetical protein
MLRAASSRSGAAGLNAPKRSPDPVDDFVAMESDLAGELCSTVDVALSAIKKVHYLQAHMMIFLFFFFSFLRGVNWSCVLYGCATVLYCTPHRSHIL